MKNRAIFNSFLLGFVLTFALMGCQNNVSGGIFNSNSNTGPTAPTTYEINSLKLGDRNYVESTLKSVFGISTTVTAAIQTFVRYQMDSFGGPWDPYRNTTEAICLRPGTTPSWGCINESTMQAPVTATATSLREALRVRACYRILNYDATLAEAPLKAAVNQAQGRSADDMTTINWATIQAPTEAEIEAAFSLFQPAEEPGQDLVSALYNLTQQIASSTAPELLRIRRNVEAWRYLFLSLCTAPEWQIP